MSETVVRVENLGKRYFLGQQKSGDLRQTFRQALTSLTRRVSSTKEEFWALKDLNFEIRRGEVVGIIGRNGAGKSTLLKILSRITYPTTGRFQIDGRVSSLLEVGTGFHFELTGRENIFLNGTILGMRRAEIKSKFDEIVAFSGVENFLDTPVKHYSSGMRVRLAFSIAAHLEPEILIIDEVLAVGDAEFQKKCLGKMDEVSKKEGRTILFVSHNMAAVEGLCSQGILLHNGSIAEINSPNEVIKKYFKINESREIELSKIPSVGNKKIIFKRMEVFANSEKCAFNNGYFQIPFNSKTDFLLEIERSQELRRPVYIAITILDINRVKLITLDNLYSNYRIHFDTEDRLLVACATENLPLNPGYYAIDLWCSDNYETFQKIEGAYRLEIVENDFHSTGKMHTKEKHGYINLSNTWQTLTLKQ